MFPYLAETTLLMWPRSKDSCNACDCSNSIASRSIYKKFYFGTPSVNAWVKPAERTCARSGSRTLHLFVVLFILAMLYSFWWYNNQMVSPQKRGNSTSSRDMEAAELKKVRSSELPFLLNVSK